MPELEIHNMQEILSPRDLRLRAKLSMTAMAALAGVAPNTYRCFELDENGVSAERREMCKAALRKLAGVAA